MFQKRSQSHSLRSPHSRRSRIGITAARSAGPHNAKDLVIRRSKGKGGTGGGGVSFFHHPVMLGVLLSWEGLGDRVGKYPSGTGPYQNECCKCQRRRTG